MPHEGDDDGGGDAGGHEERRCAVSGLVGDVVLPGVIVGAVAALVDSGSVLEAVPRLHIVAGGPRAAVRTRPHQPIGGLRAVVLPGCESSRHPRHDRQHTATRRRLRRHEVVGACQMHGVVPAGQAGVLRPLGDGLELAVDGERSGGEVHAVPGEPQGLPLT